MFNATRRGVEEALAARGQYEHRPLSGFVTGVVVLIGVYVVASIFVRPGEAPTDFNFVDERGTVTALSAVLLATGAAFSLAAFMLSTEESLRVRVFWILAAGALGGLALDELLEFHERIGDRIDALGIGAGPVRHWNDVIVIAYGVFALGFLGFFLSSIVRYPRFIELMGVAFIWFLLHTTVDSLVDPPSVVSVVVEESCKLYCSAFVSLAFFCGMLAVASKVHQSDS
ncbi:hypothetical protein OAG34_00995 [bacterium]|nr:hypothetical protein [bacterium]